MNRTQLLLEEWQYRELKKLAAKEKTSLSAVVRSFLSRLLEPKQSEKERLKLAGFIKRGKPMPEEKHDKYIYRMDWQDK